MNFLEYLPHDLHDAVITFLGFMAIMLMLTVGLVLLWVIYAFFSDITQSKHAIRRNYPVIGRFRYFFEHLGGFFRQYFFAMDREELPFNRAQRSWVYRAAKNVDSTVPFGSTDNTTGSGRIFFVNTPFPTLGDEGCEARHVIIGPHCEHPYTAKSFFNISGMSYGALSKPAVQALSAGAHQAECWINTGEGGLSPFHLEGGADIVFQIGTAKNGVRDMHGNLSDMKLKEVAAHPQVKMFELKMSQGAKPGKGGILPGEKVNEEIAKIRGVKVGEDVISPNRHREISNYDELIDFINHIRDVTGKPVGFKFVLGAPEQLDDLMQAIIKHHIHNAPDFITIDGGEGGTGAAPMALMDSVGLPLREALLYLVDSLERHGLRERIKVVASGKLINPAAVAAAICSGADFVVSARGFMFALGCIQALQCNHNTCPTGITTHDPKFQRGLDPAVKAIRVANYVKNMCKDVGVIAHSCGVEHPRQLSKHHARMIISGKTKGLDELFEGRDR